MVTNFSAMSRKLAAAAVAAVSAMSRHSRLDAAAVVTAVVAAIFAAGVAVAAATPAPTGPDGTPGAAPVAAPAEPAPPSPPAWVEMVAATESQGRIVVDVAGNAPFAATVRRQVSPALLFVDVDGLEVGPWAGTIPVGGKALREVDVVGAGPGKMRLVLRLNYLLEDWSLSKSSDGRSVRLEVSLKYRREYSVIVEPGLTFTEIRLGTEAGPLLVEALTLDNARRLYTLRAVQEGRASQGVAAGSGAAVAPPAGGTRPPAGGTGPSGGLSRLTRLASRYRALAAVNGSYFAADGRPLGLLISGGKLVSGPVFGRAALAITADGRPFVGRFGFRGEARVERWALARAEAMPPVPESFAITAVNRPREADEIVAYTPEYGATTRTNRYGLEVAVSGGAVAAVSSDGDMRIPENGVVLSAHGAARRFLAGLAVDDQATVVLRTVPDYRELGVVEAIGGGPRLLVDGRVEIAAAEEHFRPDVVIGRAPRTAVGITGDGSLLLVTVNGRQSGLSAGVTLEELAEIMRDLGARDAMNLDGGGSTTMVIRGQVFNFPSDGAERPINSALLIVPLEDSQVHSQVGN